jgi:eukaryotic-like serine/threonine-protein kinase
VTKTAQQAAASPFPRRFGERYVLLKELGKGGMGQVFMAVTGEPGAERVCALKIIRNLASDRAPEDLSARFLDEAKVVTKLSHENLVFVFDYGLVRNQGYLAMEFVQGKTLTELWNRCAHTGIGFPVGVSLFLVSELVAGLGYAHGLGDLRLVHRDVSPSNVMLSYTGGVKLIDFGLAKWKSKVAETATGVNWGKVSYMSPEQYLGRPIDSRSDLYSAGLMLWELLTGRQLFPSSEARARDPEIPPPSRMNAHLPPDLDVVVMQALAADPASRYQSGEEMYAALQAHLPRDAGKLQLAGFLRGLFESDLRLEAQEQEALVAGAAKLRSRTGRDALAGSGNGASGEERDPLLGQVLAERYYVRRLVGEGAMGRVYEGHHTGIGKRVAIKIPRHGERRKSELIQRFRLEAQAASQIGHPNIADVTDCGHTPDGRFFFVMEFVDGIDLAQLVRREGALAFERALLIAIQACRALEAAHKAGIIHRDLKPSNLMLVRDRDHEEEEGDFVKVLDFGVAKFLRSDPGGGEGAELTRTDAAVGTPKYMAPEQIEKGQEIDFRVDIYAVGGILFFMLSGGQAPIEGDTVQNLWRKKIFEDPTPLGRYRADLPPDLADLVMRCLARAPGGRPPSMQALRRELLAAVEKLRTAGSSVLALRQPSSTSVIEAAARPRPLSLGAALLVVGISAAITAAVGLLAARVRGNQQAPATASSSGRETAPATSATKTESRAASPSAGRAPDFPAPSPPMSERTAPTEPPPRLAPESLNRRGPRAAGGATKPRVPATPKTETPKAKGDPAAMGAEVARLLERAETKFQEGAFVEAIRLGHKAQAAGGGVEAWLLLGKSYRQTEQFEEAVAAYDQALKLDPQNARARRGRERALAGRDTPAGAP